MRYIFIVLFLLFSVSTSFSLSKLRSRFNKIFYQDSTRFLQKKFWFTLSGGPSIGVNKSGLYVLLLGPGIDFNWIDRNYHYFKIKASVHLEAYYRSFGWTHDLFQKSVEVNFMTGKLFKLNKNNLHSFTYGIGIIKGIKRGKILQEGGGGGSLFGVSPATYSEDPFLIIGIPLEYKFQSGWFGVGLDANLNPYLPYLGTKIFIQFKSKYYK